MHLINEKNMNLSQAEREEKLKNIRKLAKLLDSQFTLPGTNFKFGIDPILDLIPVIGSFSGFIVGFVLIWMARKNGAQGKVLLKMIGNIFIDFLVGLIPVLGNISDFVIKANVKNVRLLEEHFIEDKHQGSGIWIIISFIISVTAIILGLIYAVGKGLEIVSNHLQSIL